MSRLVTIVCILLAAAGASAAEGLQARVAAARAGDTIRVAPGVYAGPVLIDKPLTLVADGPGAVIQGTGNGDVVKIVAAGSTLRGFVVRRTGTDLDRENAGVVITAPRVTVEGNTIEDALFGITLRDAAGAVIRHNDVGGKVDMATARRGDGIKLWNSNGAVIEHNYVHDCRDLVMWYSQDLVVRGNKVERCRYGIHFMYAGQATVEDNDLRDNSVGIFLLYGQGLVLRRIVLSHNRGPSGFGLGLKDVDGVDAHDNVFADNRVALHVDNSPSRHDLTHTYRRNVFAHNDVALGLMPSVRNNRFVANSFFDNVEQVAVFGGGNLGSNVFTVDGVGNYWSDYRGYDADGDGVGDIPHRSQSLFENLMDREPRLRLFLFGPGQQAVEMASHAFPVVQPKVRATDAAPLMRSVRVENPILTAPGAAGGWSVAAILAAAALLTAGGWVMVLGKRELR
jgi:nitrous oxidase accessory protein